MQEDTTTSVSFPSLTSEDVLTGILREGAQRLLATAVEAEVSDWIDSHVHLKDGDGHRQVVRNGHLPERNITTGLGDVQVRQPRVHDRSKGRRLVVLGRRLAVVVGPVLVARIVLQELGKVPDGRESLQVVVLGFVDVPGIGKGRARDGGRNEEIDLFLASQLHN